MANPSDLISHYSSKAFLTRIAALSFVGAVVGAVLDKIDKPFISAVVGFAVMAVVVSLAELNRRYTHSYLSACRAAASYLESDTQEGKATAKRWEIFRRLNESKWNTTFWRFLLNWFTYLPGLALGMLLVGKSCWPCRGLTGITGWIAVVFAGGVLLWWIKISSKPRLP